MVVREQESEQREREEREPYIWAAERADASFKLRIVARD